jgi:hypothetical protein
MKSILISIGVVVALIVFVKVTGGSNTAGTEHVAATTFVSEKVSSEMAVLDGGFVDLGEIPIRGGDVDALFRFKNNGSDPVSLVYGETSCMCTEAVVKKADGTLSSRIQMPGHGSSGRLSMVIEPGEEAQMTATFDPMAHGPSALGPIMREIIIQTNSETTPELRFSFQGNVVE